MMSRSLILQKTQSEKEAHDTFKQFIEEYETHLMDSPSNDDIIEITLAKHTPLKTETWKRYKENFDVDTVIIVGKETDYYKVYCGNITNNKALFFNLKSDYDLNNIQVFNLDKIYIGNLTYKMSVNEAIDKLNNCPYSTGTKPNCIIFNEMIEFLKTKTPSLHQNS